MVISAQTEEQGALAPRWRAAHRETERVIRQHSRTFYFATGLLPLPKRSAIRALYAFCRRTDDLVDRSGATLEDLEDWRARVNLPPAEQTDPALMVWARVREQHGIDRRYEQELIDGVAMDIRKRQYATWEELEDYCYHVASTVGLMSIPVIGTAKGVSFEEAAPHAVKLGIALQLTNILRDVGEDAARGRVYLPGEDLARHGLTAKDIAHKVRDQRFKNLMRFEIERARALFAEALPGIGLLGAGVRPAVGAAALLYRAILDEIERIDYDVHNRRAFTTGARKVSMLPGILVTIGKMGKNGKNGNHR